MRKLLEAIDQSLRGNYTNREQLREGKIGVGIRTLCSAGLLLGITYGAFMGLYAPLRPENPSFPQLFATMVKVPLLFLLTLAVTFPSLYVFSALAGSRLRFLETLRFLLIGVLVNLALVASFGPVTGFFTLSTESYPFILVLNVIFFGVGGIAGLVFIYRGLKAVVSKDEDTDPAWEAVPPLEEPAPATASESSSSTPSQSPKSPSRDAKSPAPGYSRRIQSTKSDGAVAVFYVWSLIFGVVGAQMGWILRPFVGSPNLPFEWFRTRESHFFEAIGNTLSRLFS